MRALKSPCAIFLAVALICLTGERIERIKKRLDSEIISITDTPSKTSTRTIMIICISAAVSDTIYRIAPI